MTTVAKAGLSSLLMPDADPGPAASKISGNASSKHGFAALLTDIAAKPAATAKAAETETADDTTADTDTDDIDSGSASDTVAQVTAPQPPADANAPADPTAASLAQQTIAPQPVVATQTPAATPVGVSPSVKTTLAQPDRTVALATTKAATQADDPAPARHGKRRVRAVDDQDTPSTAAAPMQPLPAATDTATDDGDANAENADPLAVALSAPATPDAASSTPSASTDAAASTIARFQPDAPVARPSDEELAAAAPALAALAALPVTAAPTAAPKAQPTAADVATMTVDRLAARIAPPTRDAARTMPAAAPSSDAGAVETPVQPTAGGPDTSVTAGAQIGATAASVAEAPSPAATAAADPLPAAPSAPIDPRVASRPSDRRAASPAVTATPRTAVPRVVTVPQATPVPTDPVPTDAAPATAAVAATPAQTVTPAAPVAKPLIASIAAPIAVAATASVTATNKTIPARARSTSADTERTAPARATAATSASVPGAAAPAIVAAGTAPAPATSAGQQLAAGVADRAIDVAKHAAWADSIANDVASVSAATGTARFGVAPIHLGTVQVEVSRSADGMGVRLTADRQETVAALADAKTTLVAEAKANGLHLADAKIDIGRSDGGGSTGDNRGSQPQSQWQQPERPATANDASTISLTSGGYGGGVGGERPSQHQGQAQAQPQPVLRTATVADEAPAATPDRPERPADGRYA